MNGVKIMADAVKITRVFDAPVKRVWKFWAESKYCKKWWGPEGFSAPAIKIDFRVGGTYLYCMRGPDKKDYWNTGTYKKIIPLKQIINTDSFADKNGKIVPASYYGMPGIWPKQLLVTFTFEDKKGKTKLTITQAGVPKKMIAMCKLGWATSLDKIDRNL